MREMNGGIIVVAAMLMLPAVAAAQQHFEIFGGAVELPPPMQEAPVKGEKKCEPRSAWLTPLLASHAALQIGDAHSTRRALKTGLALEANPFARWVMASDVRAYTVKTGAGAGLWLGLDRYACKRPRRALWIAIAANALYGFVVISNYSRLGTLESKVK